CSYQLCRPVGTRAASFCPPPPSCIHIAYSKFACLLSTVCLDELDTSFFSVTLLYRGEQSSQRGGEEMWKWKKLCSGSKPLCSKQGDTCRRFCSVGQNERTLFS